MTDATKRCPLERFTVYWCDGVLGIHISGHSGLWNGERMRPEEVVRADLYDTARAERDEVEAETVRRIVAWLNGVISPQRYLRDIAEDIERGDWRKT